MFKDYPDVVNAAQMCEMLGGISIKAADKLSAHIKCLEEQKAGNTEFDSAAKQTWDSMKAMALPELDWFLDHCLAAFSLTLDELK